MKTILKENPEIINELSDQLKAMSGAVRRLLAGPLNRKAVVLLICEAMPVKVRLGRTQIDDVITAIEGLDSQYLRKKIKDGK